MNGDIVTSDPAFLMFNAIFNNVIIVTIGFIVAVIMYKIVTSGATASDTIGKVKFAAIFLLVTGALYGVWQTSLQTKMYMWTAGLSNTLINQVDPNYIKNNGTYYGKAGPGGTGEFGVTGIKSDWSFDAIQNATPTIK